MFEVLVYLFCVCVCMCLQQHVRRQVVKDFDKSVNPFQNRNREQHRLAGNLSGSSVTEQCEQQTKNEIKNRRMDEMKRGETNTTSLIRHRSRDGLWNENPDSATHTKLPKNVRDACR